MGKRTHLETKKKKKKKQKQRTTNIADLKVLTEI